MLIDMKKKERLILGKGFLAEIRIRTKEWHPVFIPQETMRKLYCRCIQNCSCKSWNIILER